MSEEVKWQPIESAPKDGTAFLGYIPAHRGYVARQDIEVVHWTQWGGGAWENLSGFKIIPKGITHWMPLPEPPTNKPGM